MADRGAELCDPDQPALSPFQSQENKDVNNSISGIRQALGLTDGKWYFNKCGSLKHLVGYDNHLKNIIKSKKIQQNRNYQRVLHAVSVCFAPTAFVE